MQISHILQFAFINLLIGHVGAVSWYFLTFWAPSGERFVEFSGNMVAPNLRKAGTYYLWPGLQPTDRSGVYQQVLDGKSGTWWFGSGWCCSNPSLPWGGGFNVVHTNVMRFNNTQVDSTNWSSAISLLPEGVPIINRFPLAQKSFNQAVFAIELYDVTWDFGPLTFSNILIRSTGTDKSWCNSHPANYQGSTNFTMTQPHAIVVGNAVECHIDWLILTEPLK